MLSKGSYGTVYLCVDKQCLKGSSVAVKVFKDTKDSPLSTQIIQSAIREALLLQQCQGPHVVQMHNALRSKSGRIYLILEYIPYVLSAEISERRHGGMPYDMVWNLLRQVVMGVRHLHRHQIIHRDIKPSNIMITEDGTVKLIDLGLACKCDHPHQAHLTEYVQTRWYRAPELLVGAAYGFEVDIWAVGCVAAEMLIGQPLLRGKSHLDQLQVTLNCFGTLPRRFMEVCNGLINTGELELVPDNEATGLIARLPLGIPLVLRDIVVACLQPDPLRRPTAGELLQRLPPVMPQLCSPASPPAVAAVAAKASFSAKASPSVASDCTGLASAAPVAMRQQQQQQASAAMLLAESSIHFNCTAFKSEDARILGRAPDRVSKPGITEHIPSLTYVAAHCGQAATGGTAPARPLSGLSAVNRNERMLDWNPKMSPLQRRHVKQYGSGHGSPAVDAISSIIEEESAARMGSLDPGDEVWPIKLATPATRRAFIASEVTPSRPVSSGSPPSAGAQVTDYAAGPSAPFCGGPSGTASAGDSDVAPAAFLSAFSDFPAHAPATSSPRAAAPPLSLPKSNSDRPLTGNRASGIVVAQLASVGLLHPLEPTGTIARALCQQRSLSRTPSHRSLVQCGHSLLVNPKAEVTATTEATAANAAADAPAGQQRSNSAVVVAAVGGAAAAVVAAAAEAAEEGQTECYLAQESQQWPAGNPLLPISSIGLPGTGHSNRARPASSKLRERGLCPVSLSTLTAEESACSSYDQRSSAVASSGQAVARNHGHAELTTAACLPRDRQRFSFTLRCNMLLGITAELMRKDNALPRSCPASQELPSSCPVIPKGKETPFEPPADCFFRPSPPVSQELPITNAALPELSRSCLGSQELLSTRSSSQELSRSYLVSQELPRSRLSSQELSRSCLTVQSSIWTAPGSLKPATATKTQTMHVASSMTRSRSFLVPSRAGLPTTVAEGPTMTSVVPAAAAAAVATTAATALVPTMRRSRSTLAPAMPAVVLAAAAATPTMSCIQSTLAAAITAVPATLGGRSSHSQVATAAAADRAESRPNGGVLIGGASPFWSALSAPL